MSRITYDLCVSNINRLLTSKFDDKSNNNLDYWSTRHHFHKKKNSLLVHHFSKPRLVYFPIYTFRDHRCQNVWCKDIFLRHLQLQILIFTKNHQNTFQWFLKSFIRVLRIYDENENLKLSVPQKQILKPYFLAWIIAEREHSSFILPLCPY